MTTEQALIYGVTGLAGGLGVLAAAVKNLYNRQVRLHDECVKDKEELIAKNTELWRAYWRLELQVNPDAPRTQTHSGLRRRLREQTEDNEE